MLTCRFCGAGLWINSTSEEAGGVKTYCPGCTSKMETLQEIKLHADGYTINLVEWTATISDGSDKLESVDFSAMSAFGLATWLRDRIGEVRMRIITGRDDGCWINITGGNVYLISHYDHAEMVDADDITKMTAPELAVWIDCRHDW